MKTYALSYPVETVQWNGEYVVRLPKESYLPTLRMLQSVGIREVMLSGYVTIEEASFDMLEETARLGELLDSMGMRPAQHHGLSAIYAPLDQSQEPVVERLIQSVRYTANLNSPALVIHPSHYHEPESWKKHVTTQALFQEQCARWGEDAVLATAVRNLRQAAVEAKRLGVKICLENVDRFEPMGSPDHLCRLVREVDSPFVGFCLDSGHAHCGGLKSVPDWVRTAGDKLFTTHFHDNRGPRGVAPVGGLDEHMPPGFGTIPWIDVIQALWETGYDRTVNFESGPWPTDDPESGYRCAIAYWRACETLAAAKLPKAQNS